MGQKENMRLRFTMADIVEAPTGEEGQPKPLGAVIKVVGVGGGGGNAINRMISAGVEGVEFIAVNTDAQTLDCSRAHKVVQIGTELTRGLGTGGNPTVGRDAALEDKDRLSSLLSGADMVFITTGLGGGTGTGASPVVAQIAADQGALVVAVVTKPFKFEGRRRSQSAEEGLAELKRSVDTVITIPNEKLLATLERNTPVAVAFAHADDVLRQAVQGISELILTTGEINRDFADVRTVMKGMGMALMGAGVAEGENRAIEAAQQAISSPLLEDASIQGAKGVIINITGGDDLTLHEINDAATIISDAADTDAAIMFGYVRRREMTGKVKVTVIATGFRSEEKPRRSEMVDEWAAKRSKEWLTNGLAASGGGGASIPVGSHMAPATDGLAAASLMDPPPPIIPPQRPGDQIDLFADNGLPPHVDRPPVDRSDFDIPAFMRRIQD